MRSYLVLVLLYLICVTSDDKQCTEATSIYTAMTVDASSADTQLPYRVLLNVRNRGICTGVIVHNRFILTTAVCADHMQMNKYRVYAIYGIIYPGTNGSYVDIDGIIVHEFYDPTIGRHNIALLHTECQIRFSQYVHSIQFLPKHSQSSCTDVENKHLYLLGWSKSEVSKND